MRGIYIWRRFLINLLFVIVLLFFSTPAAIFAFIQKYFNLDFFSFEWTDYIPKPFGPLLKVYLPALVIVLLNQVVILFIDIFSNLTINSLNNFLWSLSGEIHETFCFLNQHLQKVLSLPYVQYDFSTCFSHGF